MTSHAVELNWCKTCWNLLVVRMIIETLILKWWWGQKGSALKDGLIKFMTVGFDQICAISLILFVVMGSLGFQKVMTQPENLDQIRCRVLELPSPRNGESNAYLLSVNFLICGNLYGVAGGIRISMSLYPKHLLPDNSTQLLKDKKIIENFI